MAGNDNYTVRRNPNSPFSLPDKQLVTPTAPNTSVPKPKGS